MTNGPRGHFGGALQHVKSRHNHGQSMFKELAKELGQDPAVVSRGLGKLAEALASRPELRGVVETLYKHMRQDDAQKIDKGEKRCRETGTFYFSLPNGPRCSKSGACQEQGGLRSAAFATTLSMLLAVPRLL
jgi:hypothetical protein